VPSQLPGQDSGVVDRLAKIAGGDATTAVSMDVHPDAFDTSTK
jgi:hypothetical protein